MRYYLANLCTNIYGKKQTVYWVQTFGNLSLFVLIGLELDRIVHDGPNIEVT
jgi:hypothetical protein